MKFDLNCAARRVGGWRGRVLMVDAGDGEPVQVVCGGKNARVVRPRGPRPLSEVLWRGRLDTSAWTGERERRAAVQRHGRIAPLHRPSP